MRFWIVLAGAVLAVPASAAPPDSVSPMTMPGQAGVLQPGNPNRGITMVGPENALVRQRHGRTVTCISRRGREARCAIGAGKIQLVRRIDGRCREGRDWYQKRKAVVVTNGCRAIFRAGR